MHRGIKIVLLTMTTATLLTVVACKNSTINNNNPPICADVSCRNSPGTITGGANAVITIVSSTVFNSYAGRPVSPTSPIQLNINVKATGNVYLGEANIFYNEGASYRQGHFTNGTETGYGNDVHVLTVDSSSGIPTYRFFFEDPAGVIIVTLQQEGGLPSDTTFGTLSGIVYFRNFNTMAPNPLYQSYTDQYGYYWPSNPHAFCWSGQITTGPYNCMNMSVQPSTSTNNPVTKLGTFTGLDKKAAFNL